MLYEGTGMTSTVCAKVLMQCRRDLVYAQERGKRQTGLHFSKRNFCKIGLAKNLTSLLANGCRRVFPCQGFSSKIRKSGQYERLALITIVEGELFFLNRNTHGK